MAVTTRTKTRVRKDIDGILCGANKTLRWKSSYQNFDIGCSISIQFLQNKYLNSTSNNIPNSNTSPINSCASSTSCSSKSSSSPASESEVQHGSSSGYVPTNSDTEDEEFLADNLPDLSDPLLTSRVKKRKAQEELRPNKCSSSNSVPRLIDNKRKHL